MMQPQPEPVPEPADAYAFGDFCLDVRRMSLTRAGAPVAIEPKAFDVLRHLVEHRDRLVGKDELLDVVWKDTFVTPNALTRVVAQLRKALGDDAAEARYIETVAKRGYRFIAPVDAGAGVRRLIVEPAQGPRAPARHMSVAVVLAVVVALGLGLAGWLVWRAGEGGRESLRAPPVATRLTSGRGYDSDPVLSPDGRRIAYTSDRSGGLEIYTTSLTPGGRETPVTSDGQENHQPDWSPDGESLVFHSRKRGGIWIANASGGPPRQIVDFGSAPAWSPDGARIVFESDAGGLGTQSTLWTVRADGSDRRALTSVGAPRGGHHRPSWSRDGRYVAFGVATGLNQGEVWVATLSGQLTRVFGGNPIPTDPAFGPDDRALYWTTGTLDGNGRVWRAAWQEGRAEAPVLVLSIDSGTPQTLSIGSDGTTVYSSLWSDANLWTLDLTAKLPAEPARLTDGLLRTARPVYSHDGRIAFMRSSPGGRPAAWVMAEDGSGSEPVLADSDSGAPSWAPDGRLLVASRRDGRERLWWVPLATRRPEPLPFEMNGMINWRLSPDGRHLAYHVIDAKGRMNIWLRPVDGGPARQLTFDEEAITYPCWSPDGRWLAVEIKRGERTHVGVLPSMGGAVVQLTDADGQSWPHSWAPDNDRIVFAAERDAVWNLWQVSRTTGTASPLTRFTSSSGYVRYPAVSPRGDRIVFERSMLQGNLWTVKLP